MSSVPRSFRAPQQATLYTANVGDARAVLRYGARACGSTQIG